MAAVQVKCSILIYFFNASAVAYDIYDGHQPQEKLSSENKKVALMKRPSFLEFFGYTFFPATFLVGPQFSLKRYQDFVNSNFSDEVSIIYVFLSIGYMPIDSLGH